MAHHVKKYKKSIYLLLGTLLLIQCFNICNYFYPTNSPSDIEGWWYLKMDLYVLSASCFVYAGSLGKTKCKECLIINKYLYIIAVTYCLSTFFERRVLNRPYFDVLDTLTMVLMVVFTEFAFKRIKQLWLEVMK